MEHLLTHFVPYLNEIAILAIIEILISLLLEEPTFFSLNAFFDPIFAKPDMSSLQAMAYTLYATGILCIFQFLKAFSKMPMVEAGEYQMAALYWYPVMAFELVKNHMDDDWDYIAPLLATIHHIYMVFVCGFIGLSMACGLMIHNHLPSWKIPFVKWFRSVGAFIATICSGTFRVIRYIYAAVESLLERCLDWLLTDNPLWLIASSTGLILGDILLAMWAANFLVSSRSSAQLNMTESWNVSSRMPRRGPILTWHFGDPIVPGYGWKVVDLIRYFLADIQSYPARFAHWYNNQHELDEMHHYPALTGTIAFLIVCLGFKWIWEDKPQRLRQVEHTNEETLRKNAITHDFEDYLRERSSRTDSCKAFMATNLKVCQDIIARNRTLMNQYQFVAAQAAKVQANLTERAQQLDTYMRENLDLRGVNTYLQTEISRLRASTDLQTHTASMEALNAQLASANNENINLQQQREHLHQELAAIRESRAAAEARATAAERVWRMAVTERSALCADVERLEQQNAELQLDNQELSEQQSALEREKEAAEAAANTATELRSRNNAMAAHVQSLQARLEMQEARSAETIRAAEETVRALQVELDALRRDQDPRTRDLENLLVREEQTRTVVRRRAVQMRKVHRVKQKKASNLKIKWQDAARTAEAYRKHNISLEKRLLGLDPTLKGSTQIIHDPRKDDEVRKLRDQLERSQARNRLLEEDVRVREEEIVQLQRQSATATTMSPAQQSPSTPRSRTDSDEVVRLRIELTRAEQENQRLRVRISTLEMQQGDSRSGNPLMRGQSRGSRGSRRG